MPAYDADLAVASLTYTHVTTVERIIGYKQGTGGPSGAPYLRRMLDVALEAHFLSRYVISSHQYITWAMPCLRTTFP